MKSTVCMTQEILRMPSQYAVDHPTCPLYPGGFNPWISNVTEDTPVLTSTGQPVTCGERQIPDTVLTPRFQPGPSAGNSFDPKEGRFPKDYGADQQRLQISDLHFEKFPTPTTFACWKNKIQN